MRLLASCGVIKEYEVEDIDPPSAFTVKFFHLGLFIVGFFKAIFFVIRRRIESSDELLKLLLSQRPGVY